MAKPDFGQLVDRDFYLATYPDVAAAEVDPVVHFKRHGRFEGRLPCNIAALPLERDLWANAFSPERFLDELQSQAEKEDINSLYAASVLAAFLLFQARFIESSQYSDKVLAKIHLVGLLRNYSALFLVAFEGAYYGGDFNKASQLLSHKEWKLSNAKLLAMQMMAAKEDGLKFLNRIYKKSRLLTLGYSNPQGKLDSLSVLYTPLSSFFHKYRRRKCVGECTVSVIVPLYNAEKTIRVAIESLLSQTWEAIEIVIIDDCSTDGSLDVLRQYKTYPNIKIASNTQNSGAYPTRNRGAQLASGQFITVMDADDWAHPQKIEQQVRPLLKSQELMATVSHWARCNNDLDFSRLRIDHSWIYRNISSLMVRRSVFTDIGFWDSLKAGADTEFYLRLMRQYGEESVLEVCPDIPLSFGRIHQNSLTQSSATHLVTQFGGVRQEHLAFAHVWHLNAQKPLMFTEASRPFPVPGELTPTIKNEADDTELERWRNVFDNEWYLKTYTSVNRLGLSIHDHFWVHGEREDLSPSPLFVPSAYRYVANLTSDVSPTWHALTCGWNFKEAVSLKGDSNTSGMRIALFAHSLSKEVFGAELSFLNVVLAASKSGYSITVFLPNAINPDYVSKIRKCVNEVVFIPLPWFSKKKQYSEKIVRFLNRYFNEYGVKLVYVNTIMLFEPYIAAQQSSVQVLTHVRELPEQDEHLQGLLNESSVETLSRLASWSDYFVANSYFTAKWLSGNKNAFILYNQAEEPATIKPIDVDAPLKVCMLSSNILKKGIEDFYLIAERCADAKIEFNLYGPLTTDVMAMEKKFPNANVHKHGYSPSPETAIQQNDIVLSLSWFQESFGRTAAEAMINERIIIGYDWGAIGEVVGDSGGLLVPYKNKEQIVKYLLDFAEDKETLVNLSKSARERAKLHFSKDAFISNFRLMISSVMSK